MFYFSQLLFLIRNRITKLLPCISMCIPDINQLNQYALPTAPPYVCSLQSSLQSSSSLVERVSMLSSICLFLLANTTPATLLNTAGAQQSPITPAHRPLLASGSAEPPPPSRHVVFQIQRLALYTCCTLSWLSTGCFWHLASKRSNFQMQTQKVLDGLLSLSPIRNHRQPWLHREDCTVYMVAR